MEWIQTAPGLVICGLALWLLLSIAFCFLLGQIANRLKGSGGDRPGKAVKALSGEEASRPRAPLQGLPES